MQKFEYYSPTRIVFGRDTEKRAGELLKEEGAKKVFVVYGGKSAKASGLIDRVCESIRAAGIDAMAMGGVVPNPLLSKVMEMVEAAIAFNADFILAVGGGSAIDTAKYVAHGAANPGVNVWDFISGQKKLTKSIPHGAVLTISAAGSETSDSAVLTNDMAETVHKRGMNTVFNRCRFAIMNPELTYTLPKYQIAAGAADIFMHTSERYFSNITGNHMSDEIAEGLFRNIICYGKKGVEKPDDYEAMSEIMWSGSISHMNITGLGCRGDGNKEGDWACHQLGMTISALYDSTHGATLTAVWGSWARYVCEENVSRFAQFARKVYGIAEADDRAAADIGIEKTEEFFKELGMPVSLGELFGREVSEDEIKALSDNCSWSGTRSIGGFKLLDGRDVYNIYKLAK